MATYEEYQRALGPTWLQEANGEAWLGAFGTAKDVILARAKDSVKARLPDLAPADALPHLAVTMQLERGPDEAEAAFRARLKEAFNAWVWGGTRKGLLEYALTPAGLENADTIENRQWSPAPPDGDTAFWSRFWVVIGEPHPWDDDDSWDGDASTWDDDATATWDSTATLNDVERVKRLIRQWKPGHTTPVAVVLVFSETIHLWDGPDEETWDEAAASGETWGSGSAFFALWPF